MQTEIEQRGSERRRPDWQENDRRQNWPWVMDSNDRRSGQDRRLNEGRLNEGRVRQAVAARQLEAARQIGSGASLELTHFLKPL